MRTERANTMRLISALLTQLRGKQFKLPGIRLDTAASKLYCMVLDYPFQVSSLSAHGGGTVHTQPDTQVLVPMSTKSHFLSESLTELH